MLVSCGRRLLFRVAFSLFEPLGFASLEMEIVCFFVVNSRVDPVLNFLKKFLKRILSNSSHVS